MTAGIQAKATPQAITEQLKGEARRLGFDLAGACPAVSPARLDRFVDWLEAGFAGEMDYLPQRRQAYEHPKHLLQRARSVLMLGMNYWTAQRREIRSGSGLVSRYAWAAADYHDVIHARLNQLVSFLKDRIPGCQARGVVDTAPLLEREFAQLAGLGWVGKNTLLLNRRHGSWLFLAAVLTDLELQYDAASETDHCGTCRACLDACPTQAFPQPYVLDARRCISYLTIELRNTISEPLRSSLGDWVFGCDVCQDVCPWNRRTPLTGAAAFSAAPDRNPLELIDLFALSDEDFRQLFRRTPLWRAKRRGLLRNAAIVLGNQRDPGSAATLGCGLDDVEPLVRAACAWALGQIDGPEPICRQIATWLTRRQAIEEDATVQEEIKTALAKVKNETTRTHAG